MTDCGGYCSAVGSRRGECEHDRAAWDAGLKGSLPALRCGVGRLWAKAKCADLSIVCSTGKNALDHTHDMRWRFSGSGSAPPGQHTDLTTRPAQQGLIAC